MYCHFGIFVPVARIEFYSLERQLCRLANSSLPTRGGLAVLTTQDLHTCRLREAYAASCTGLGHALESWATQVRDKMVPEGPQAYKRYDSD